MSPEHPTTDALLAAADGDATGAVRRHLDVCARCRRTVDDLRGAPLPAGEDPERDRSWEALRARIAEEDAPPAPPGRRPPPGLRQRVLPFAAATAFALLAGGLAVGGWWANAVHQDLQRARERIAALESEAARTGAPPRATTTDRRAPIMAPRARVATVDLVPEGALRTGDEATAVTVGPRAELVLLRLLLTGMDETAVLRLEARSEAGQVLWHLDDVRPDDLETIDVVVPASALPEGLVHLELDRADRRDEPEGTARESEPPLAEYRLRVRHDGARQTQ